MIVSDLRVQSIMDLVPNIDYFCFEDDWLNKRMLFIAGPRQVGKTTYAKKKIEEFRGAYFNWDIRTVREAYRHNESFFAENIKSNDLVVFDEIHKMTKWKNILKGIFDGYRDDYRFLITGSAKLDTFRRSGDSLVGRYFLTHLLPISIGDLIRYNFEEFQSAETLLNTIKDSKLEISQPDLATLIQLGGFPEPFFKGSKNFASRWHDQHLELLIQEDLRDLTKIVSLDKIENLITLLYLNICKPVYNNTLAKILEVNHLSVKQWIVQLEKIMLIFSIQPWSKKITRAIRKNPKIFFYDWSAIEDPGQKFENFIATQLYKACTLWKDRFGWKFELHYIRTYDETEVDFLISLNSKPWLLVEAKHGKPDIPSSMYRFSKELNVPAVLVTAQGGWNMVKNGVHVISADRFLSKLP